MALQFDANGLVALPNFNPSGEFTLAITFEYSTTGNSQYVLSTTSNSANYVRCTNGGVVVRLNFSTFASPGSYSDGQEITITIARDGFGNTTVSDGTNTTASQIVSGGTYNRLGGASGGGSKYDGVMSGLTTTVGGVGDRTYDFDQAPASTTLPDTTSSQDGTLSGFITGGFIPSASVLVITSVSDYESKQRDGSGNATFTIAGIKDATNTAIEYTIDGGSNWNTLTAASAATTFTGDVVINGKKDLQVRYATDTGITDSVTGLMSCMHIVAWWQSNCRGQGLVDQTVSTTGIIPHMYTDAGFELLTDPSDSAGTAGGSMWPRLVSQLADEGIPVCISNVAVDGTSINDWLKSAATNYTRITDASTSLGGIELCISVGGETDSSNSMSEATMTTKLTQMVEDLDSDFSCDCRIVKFPIGDTTGGNQSIWDGIRAAYDAVVSAKSYCYNGGDLSVIDIDVATAAGNDGIHIKQSADLTTGANIIYASFSTSTINITATGIPDGTYPVLIFDPTDYSVIHGGDAAFASNTASIASVQVAVGTDWRGVVFDNEDPNDDGAPITGTTA